MLVLKVELNGSVVATAGLSNLGVLSAMVTASAKHGAASTEAERVSDQHKVGLDVGGLFLPHVDGSTDVARWGPTRALSVGDEVMIRVLESDVADQPRRRAPTLMDEAEERAHFNGIREEYMRLRDRYEMPEDQDV